MKLVANSVDELPAPLQQLLAKAGVSQSDAEQHWWLVLAILQFVGKTRFENPWKDKQKALVGTTGRDYRGATDALLRSDIDPNKLYKRGTKLGQG